jgi:hypothetical protein
MLGSRSTANTVRLRLSVRLGRTRLDALLAEGRDPGRDPRLALRAQQLVRPSARRRLVARLAEAVRSADDPPSPRLRPEVPVDRVSVHACRAELAELEATLLSKGEPRVRGVAIARTLLLDGAGPLYARGQGDRLRNVAWTARSAL